MAEIRIRTEEGHYTIKRVPKLPKRGNANWLFAIIDNKIEEFYRWDALKKEWETIIVVGSGGITNIQEGTNVTITGTGTTVDPLIINSVNTDTLPTGLEKLDEGNGEGWRLIGVDNTKYGNIGLNSVDLNLIDPSEPVTTDRGVTAPYSFSAGSSNKITGLGYSNAIGSSNEITASAGSNYNNSAIGGYNKIFQGYGNTTLGTYNEVNISLLGTTLAGMNNRATGSHPAGASGIALDVRANNHFAVGASNTIWGGGIADANRPVFTVGIGTHSTPGAAWEAIVRKDGFNVNYDGSIVAPSITNALIDLVGAKSLVSREWVLANIPSGSLPYTTYVAILTQAGTADPTALVLENTLGATITWTRDAVGDYTATTSSAVLDITKTVIQATKGISPVGLVRAFCNGTSVIKLQNYDDTGSVQDTLTRLSIEIRVYP